MPVYSTIDLRKMNSCTVVVLAHHGVLPHSQLLSYSQRYNYH